MQTRRNRAGHFGMSLVVALSVVAAGCGGDGQPADAGAEREAATGSSAAGLDAARNAPDAGGGAADASVSPDRPVDTQAPADAAATDAAADAATADGGAVTWAIDNLESIGGHRTTVLGAPTVIETPQGRALAFDGVDDALFVEDHPLARLPQFTVEIYFRPDAGGAPAQRFFHMQDDGSGGRVLFETRLPGNDTWVLDVFVESSGGSVAVYDAARTHPLGAWYHLAAVVDGQRARSYVNGIEQASFPLVFRPHQGGRTSIGVRITRMYYFKGAIRAARFTPRVLTPAEFLPPP